MVVLVALRPTPEVTVALWQREYSAHTFGLNFQKLQQHLQQAEPETLRAPSRAEAAGSVALACLAKAATAAMVVPTELTQPAMALGAVGAAVQQTEGTDLMDICGLLTGALTDGNF